MKPGRPERKQPDHNQENLMIWTRTASTALPLANNASTPDAGTGGRMPTGSGGVEYAVNSGLGGVLATC
jgi:hypothetical protein